MRIGWFAAFKTKSSNIKSSRDLKYFSFVGAQLVNIKYFSFQIKLNGSGGQVVREKSSFSVKN